MKRPALALIILVFLAGCVSDDKSKYQLITMSQLESKVHEDRARFETTFNKWKYAGSDAQYDYIYEYKPGIFPTPDSDFQYFKLGVNQIEIKYKHDFAPDVKMNNSLFESSGG